MANERSSLLFNQKKQQQTHRQHHLPPTQYHSRHQQHNSSIDINTNGNHPHHSESQNNPIPAPVDLLSDDETSDHNVKTMNNAVLRGRHLHATDRTVNSSNNNNHDNLIDMNFDSPAQQHQQQQNQKSDGIRYHHSLSTQQINARAKIRDETKHGLILDVLNSFDEDENKDLTSKTNTIIDRKDDHGQTNVTQILDGTFYAEDADMNINHNIMQQHHHRDAGKAMSTLFGKKVDIQTENYGNSYSSSIANDIAANNLGSQDGMYNRKIIMSNRTDNHHPIDKIPSSGRNPYQSSNTSSQTNTVYHTVPNNGALQDFLTDDNNVTKNYTQRSSLSKNSTSRPSLLDQAETNNNMISHTTGNQPMRAVASPLQITTSSPPSSSTHDLDLLMAPLSNHQQQRQPQINHLPQYSTTNNTHNPFSIPSNHTNQNNSVMTFRNTAASGNNIPTSSGSRIASTTKSNTATARSWFGGNLNSTPGTSLPASSFSALNDSSSGDGDYNVHTMGSSMNQQHVIQTLSSIEHAGEGSDTNNVRGQRTYSTNQHGSQWNWLNIALFLYYGFTTAANNVPITLIPTIAMDLLLNGGEDDLDSGDQGDDGEEFDFAGQASKFASVVATYAVLGRGLGKFLNGSLGDIFGARRVACYYSLFHSFSLLLLSFCRNGWSVICCCVSAEYYASVQWPCIAVILAAHYGNGIKGDNGGDGDKTKNDVGNEKAMNHREDRQTSNVNGRYEKGIYITSLGSRAGSLIASLATTMFLRYEGMGWRTIVRFASCNSFIAFAIMYLFVTDSPGKLHDPQNPIKENIPDFSIISNANRSRYRNRTIKDFIHMFKAMYKLVSAVFMRNILPSLRSVLSNARFWAVAIAHSGGLMVCSSFRILGTYFRDTSYGAIPENQAGIVTLFLSTGTLVGLFFGGNAFADLSNDPRARKKMISRLYILTVTMCYCLAFLAIPFVRTTIDSPYLIAFLQAIATFFMGAGVAVQVYCIPGIVGSTFGANKGLYASYTDGVACTISSIVWRIMGNAVEEGNPQGSGWAYGWAAMALLVILAGLLMVEFIEHYFCRGGWLSRLNDTKMKANYEQRCLDDYSLGDESSVSKLAESGRRMWKNRPSLFKRTSDNKRREPDINLIFSLEEEDDDDVSTIIFESANSEISFDHQKDDQSSTNIGDLKERIAQLLKCDGNKYCVDCRNPYPRWVSIIVPGRGTSSEAHNRGFPVKSLGAFCCADCAGSHRKLGTHLVFVRSIDHDSFKSHEVKALENGGNVIVNYMHEAKLPDDDFARITPNSSSIERERFITAKYEKKIWFKESNHAEIRESIGPEIELVHSNHVKHHSSPSAVVNNDSSSVFDQAAPVDQNTVEHYESFVRNGTDDSESVYSRHRHNKEEMSLSSEESDAWHISHGEERGLDDYVDL